MNAKNVLMGSQVISASMILALGKRAENYATTEGFRPLRAVYAPARVVWTASGGCTAKKKLAKKVRLRNSTGDVLMIVELECTNIKQETVYIVTSVIPSVLAMVALARDP